MENVRLILWIVIAVACAALTVWLGSLLRKKARLWMVLLVFAVKAVAVPVFGLLSIYWDTFFAWRINLLTTALYAAMLGSVLADVLRLGVELAVRLVKKAAKNGKPVNSRNEKINAWFHKHLGIRSGIAAEALIMAAVLLYGTLNMLVVLPRHWSVAGEQLENRYRIVFVSDLHAGFGRPFSTVQKMMEDIKKEKPDLLVLGGDITDEFTSSEEAEQIWKCIGSAGIPTVFVWGNHDRRQRDHLAGTVGYDAGEITEIIEKNGVKILADEYLTVGPDLVIYGREDRSMPEKRSNVDPDENPDEEAFFVILDHQQFDGAYVESMGADLQISGHSHAGQYFPLEFIYIMAQAYPSGSYEFGDSELIVSEGAGGWRTPFRTEGHCRYEVIDLEPEE